MITRETGQLDWNYLREQLLPLTELKDQPGVLDQLEHRRQKHEQ
ncbi:MAG: hypothetical protein ABR555_02655 [Pyrinomonadaceae bacterium]